MRINKFIQRNYVYLTLFFIVLFAFFIRIWNVDKNPAGFFCDEASIGYNAYSILTTGRDEWGIQMPLLFKAFGQYKDPVLIYSAIPFIKTFGLNEFSVRLTSVIYGSLAIVIIFLFTKELFNKKVALISGLFLAILPWHIHMNKIAFELNSSVFWVAMSLYLFYKTLKNIRIYPLLMLSFFVTFFTYYPVKMYLPFLFLSLIFINLNKTKFWFTKIKFWLVNIFFVILFIFLMFPYIKDNSFLSRWEEVKSNQITSSFIAKGFLNHFSYDFLFSKGDIDFEGQLVTRHSVRGIGELYLFQLPLLILGILFMVWHKQFRELFFILFFLLIYPLGTIFTDIKPQATRSIIGVIPFTILSAYGAVKLFDFIRNKKIKFISLIILLMIILLSLFNYFKLFLKYPAYSSDYWGWQLGPKEIISYFKTQTKNYDELYMTGSFNAPEIFLKFYDPESKCKNCLIGGFNNYNLNKKQLFAIRTEELSDFKIKYKIKKIIYYPNGQKAFYIIDH